jgi:hypothetical protein
MSVLALMAAMLGAGVLFIDPSKSAPVEGEDLNNNPEDDENQTANREYLTSPSSQQQIPDGDGWPRLVQIDDDRYVVRGTSSRGYSRDDFISPERIARDQSLLDNGDTPGARVIGVQGLDGDDYIHASIFGTSQRFFDDISAPPTPFSGAGAQSNLVLRGGLGNDTIISVTDQTNDAFGGQGRDTLIGVNSRLYGGAGDDVLHGRSFHLDDRAQVQVLHGGLGRDTLSLDNGFGLLTGGHGSDTFVMNFTSTVENFREVGHVNFGNVVVTDFNPAKDAAYIRLQPFTWGDHGTEGYHLSDSDIELDGYGLTDAGLEVRLSLTVPADPEIDGPDATDRVFIRTVLFEGVRSTNLVAWDEDRMELRLGRGVAAGGPTFGLVEHPYRAGIA